MKTARVPINTLGALAAGLGLGGLAWAQTPPPEPAALPVVRTQAPVDAEPDRNHYQATDSRIGKGQQELRDIPQSITVLTEKLLDDRKLTTLKETLKAASGISFQAAEGGEEDIRLRGFALQTTGDVFADGLRDPAFYDRDTFFLERVEVLRGSASMLFGRGSTGGAVNLVSKKPKRATQGKLDLSLASHDSRRAVLDYNLGLTDRSALRIGAMLHKSESNGAGSRLDKAGLALAWRSGIATPDEWQITLYHLDNRNGINYGLPWLRQQAGAAPDPKTGLLPVDPNTTYSLASDRNHGRADQLTVQHTHRFSNGSTLVSRIRAADYDRDQRASTIRFAAASAQPGGQAVTAGSLGAATVLTRGFQPKVQQMQTLHAQSDYSGRFQALGLKHELQAGIDLALERKQVDAVYSAAQGGAVPAKPNTRVGSPDDGAWVDESLRSLRRASDYRSQAAGAYLQNLAALRPDLKLLTGLRFDHLDGNYFSNAIPANAAGPVTRSGYRMTVNQWSQRLGLLYQPSPLHSFHASAATSFNTSGDAYSLSAANQNLPPEKSINLELGAKLDDEEGRFSTRFALFRSTKLRERNTDPLNTDIVTLSGKRHSAGFEADITGRLSESWEVFGSYMWMPIARIDISSANAGELQGDRPSLSPRHTGSLWAVHQLDAQWRAGLGLTARSSQTPNRNPGFAAAGFVSVDAMTEYRPAQGGTSYRLNVSNLSNRRYADALYTAHYVPGTGRVISLSASVPL